jgi:hypothetical protein
MLLLLASACATAGCGADTVLWLQVEAPLVVPAACDSLSVNVNRAAGMVAFGQTFDLSQGPQFPLTLSLISQSSADVGVPLTVTVAALKGAALAQPWSSQSTQTTLTQGQLTQVFVQLCECP